MGQEFGKDDVARDAGEKTFPAAGLMSGGRSDAGEDDPSVNPRDYVNSLARGLEVLRAFNRTGRKMTLSQVATETGNTRAGARRILLTLVHEGYAVTDGKLFDLTPQVLELGYSILSSKGVWDIARPFIAHLSDDIQESVSAAILDKFDVVYVGGTQYHRIISVGISVGARFPAHCTANGRVLLANTPAENWDAMIEEIELEKMTEHTITQKSKFRRVLKEVRQKGWSLVDQELEIGLISISVPVRMSSGELVGAINVGVPSMRMPVEQMIETILPKLLATTQNISDALKTGH
ncbi:IclR family transcriptional regulator C-terminal domain-containing protein [Jannaschia sp. KMU-145]|uniref:IclR family transcriptional regulator domain-containing protein n=1 Tax=Jannaschia halovivens TaxID=3388667 RepID=UPI00396B2121